MVHPQKQTDDESLQSPLVKTVVGKVVDLIRTQGLSIGQELPSERKLAADLTVSRGVVRAALRLLDSEGYIESRRNCRPVVKVNLLPRSGRKHIAIWLWPNTSDYAAASILKGIQTSNIGEDIRLIVKTAAKTEWSSIYEAEERFLRSVAEEPDQAGVILWYLGGERNLSALQRLRAAKIPIVFLDRLPPGGFSADYVGTNNESAAYMGVKHLLELGHRRVGLITNMDVASSVSERETGYRLALKEASISWDDALIQRDSVDDPAGVESAVHALLTMPEPPTAIFCINDHLALQAYDALGKRGVSIPGDISLVGFDGLLRWIPGGGYLTTLCQDFERMGRVGAQLLLERMESGIPDAYRHLLLDAPLTRCGSTAAPANRPTPREGVPG